MICVIGTAILEEEVGTRDVESRDREDVGTKKVSHLGNEHYLGAILLWPENNLSGI